MLGPSQHPLPPVSRPHQHPVRAPYSSPNPVASRGAQGGVSRVAVSREALPPVPSPCSARTLPASALPGLHLTARPHVRRVSVLSVTQSILITWASKETDRRPRSPCVFGGRDGQSGCPCWAFLRPLSTVHPVPESWGPMLARPCFCTATRGRGARHAVRPPCPSAAACSR